MKLRSQLIISIIIFGIVLLAISASVVLTNQQVAQIDNQEQTANNINTGASNLAYISNEYFLSRQSAQVTSWQTQFSSLLDSLSQMSSVNSDVSAQITAVEDDLERLGIVFNSTVSYVNSIPANESGIVNPLLKTDSTRLGVLNQALAFDSSVLSKSLGNLVDQQRETNSFLIFALLGVFGAYFIAVYLIVYRRTFRSIAKLQDGTRIIGSGNLDYSIDSKSNDEIGELSKAFNQMAANLKTVTASKTDLEQTQASLRESEQRWATTLASIGDAVIATDTSGKIVFMNGEAEKLTGWTLSEALEKPVKTIFNIINEQSRSEVENPIDKVLREGMVVGLANHTVIIQKNGAEVPIDDSGAPIKDKDGKTTGVVLIFRDISERKKSEDALNKLNEELEERVLIRTKDVSNERQRLYNVLETLPAYVVLLDKDYHVPFANKVFRERFGESFGRPCYDFLFNRDSPCENCETFKVLKTNGPHHWEWTGPDKRDYDIYDFPFVEADGSTLILEMGIDITERKKAEAAVQSERKRLFDVLETLPPMICLLSPDYHVVFANRSFREKFGESNGRHCYDYCFGKTEPCDFCESYEVLKTGKPHHWEVKGADGSVIDAYDFPFTDVDGSKLILEMDIDITARKKAEAEAEAATKKLKDSERLAAIGATAGMVGHDIRNPLQAIAGDVYLLKEELKAMPDREEKSSAEESLEGIEKNVDYINKIVADLQDYARPLNPRAQETNIKSLFNEILAKNGMPKNIKVTVKVDDKAEKIMADPDYLKRIAANLTLNAIQAMPNGGKLTIHTFVEEQTNDVLITVKDTGVGIPEDIKPKLFTPMMTTKSKGQGFGLAVVKRMTEGLGGTVAFESTTGKGTTFIIRLPPPKELNGKWTYK